jgi:hypothetical protein
MEINILETIKQVEKLEGTALGITCIVDLVEDSLPIQKVGRAQKKVKAEQIIAVTETT